jgi:hypothetical protein
MSFVKKKKIYIYIYIDCSSNHWVSNEQLVDKENSYSNDRLR